MLQIRSDAHAAAAELSLSTAPDCEQCQILCQTVRSTGHSMEDIDTEPDQQSEIENDIDLDL